MTGLVRCLAFLVILGASQSLAAPIIVRSGDHADFTRLVLTVRPGTEYRLRQTSGRAEIVIIGHEDGFDTRDIWRRATRDHLADLEASGGRLSLVLSCDCTVTSYRQGSTFLVFDIGPQAPERAWAEITPTEQALAFSGTTELRFSARVQRIPTRRAAAESATAETVARPPVAAGDPRQNASEAPATTPAISPEIERGMRANMVSPGRRTPAKGVTTMLADADSDAESETAFSPAIVESLQQVQQQLAEHVGRAATRGMLDPAEQRIDLPLVSRRSHIDPHIFDSSQVPAPETESRANVRVTSSSDISDHPNAGRTATLSGMQCDEPDLAAVDHWGGSGLFAREIATGRKNLYGEFDVLNQEAATRLAKRYLHFGFGAEARQIVELDPELARTSPHLSDLAEILERGFVREPRVLHRYLDCDSPLALWALLSRRTIPADAAPDVTAALRALNALPAHLRRVLAPTLSRRLLEFGDTVGADMAMRSLERLPEPLPDAGKMAQAEMDIERGAIAQAEQQLEDVVESNSELSAEALIKFVEMQLKVDGPIEPETAALVESYATELRDDPIGTQLRRALVISQAKSAQFDKAFETLAAMEDREGPLRPIRQELAGILVSTADNIVFLDRAFSDFIQTPDDLSAATRFAFAERFLRLGFPTEAKALLPPASAEVPSRDNRLVSAEIALSRNAPQIALAVLGTLDGPEASSLRARALSATGAFDAAVDVWRATGDAQQANRAAWLSDGWASLVPESLPVIGTLPKLVETPMPDSATGEGVLRRTAQALDESADARDRLRALLTLEDMPE